MTLRDQRQQELAQKWLESDKFGIIYACPRFGKIFMSINVLKEYSDNIKLLIAYPDKEIKKSWQEDFIKKDYKNPNITYTTHMSIHKYADEKFDLVIIDEIHLLSDAQIESVKELIIINNVLLGLTGTMSRTTRLKLKSELNLNVCAKYTIEQGIREGVIVDYSITVFKVPLDDKKKGMFKNVARTEKKQFSALSWIINKQQMEGMDTMFMRLARMRLIQSSEAKRLKTKELLEKNKDKRALVFCGTIKIADNLGIPSYHTKTKAKDQHVFEDFVSGKGENHLAVVKIGNSGVTYLPLDFVIINSFDSNSENLTQKINRCMGKEYGFSSKKAHIFIISTNEKIELAWLKKSLEFFDKSKIKYVE